MSITDELRKWGRATLADTSLLVRMEAIADHIDAEHEAKVSYWQGASYKDGYDEGFASADDWLAQHEDAMAEHGWIRMPKDADGEYIHVGDVMEFSAFEVEKPVTRTVDGIGQGVFFAWCGERGYQQHEAKRYRHYHAPTVEDVLREFADEVYADADNEIRDRDFLCAKYAKRLTLAETEDA